jgi:hypothetical protein
MGAELSPRQLRFWELVLELPHRQVNAWLAATCRTIWDRRTQPWAFIAKSLEPSRNVSSKAWGPF